jgi:hypothetical protein
MALRLSSLGLDPASNLYLLNRGMPLIDGPYLPDE